jgi:hypothetical protein
MEVTQMTATKHVLNEELGDELLLAKYKRHLALFAKAAHDLTLVWESLQSRDIDVGQHAYPFLQHFDEIVEGIDIWVETQAHLRLKEKVR